MHWSTEDTLKLAGLLAFVGAFVVVFQQLLRAEAKMNRKEAPKKEQWEGVCAVNFCATKKCLSNTNMSVSAFHAIVTFRTSSHTFVYLGSISTGAPVDRIRDVILAPETACTHESHRPCQPTGTFATRMRKTTKRRLGRQKKKNTARWLPRQEENIDIEYFRVRVWPIPRSKRLPWPSRTLEMQRSRIFSYFR